MEVVDHAHGEEGRKRMEVVDRAHHGEEGRKPMKQLGISRRTANPTENRPLLPLQQLPHIVQESLKCDTFLSNLPYPQELPRRCQKVGPGPLFILMFGQRVELGY